MTSSSPGHRPSRTSWWTRTAQRDGDRLRSPGARRPHLPQDAAPAEAAGARVEQRGVEGWHDGEDDEPAVVDAFRAGDPSALATLYDRWSPVVYSLALRSLDDVTAAEEVTRRVFTRAWLSRETFEPERTGFADWMVELARTSIADARASTGPCDGPAARATSERSGEDESTSAGLAERLLFADGMSHLDATPRRMLRMALVDGLAPAQIAESAGLPVDEVTTHIASGLMELRRRQEVEPDAR